MEMIEDYRKNPFYKLEADEEFIIKNYRLIKKKREPDTGREDQAGRGVGAVSSTYSPTPSPNK